MEITPWALLFNLIPNSLEVCVTSVFKLYYVYFIIVKNKICLTSGPTSFPTE